MVLVRVSDHRHLRRDKFASLDFGQVLLTPLGKGRKEEQKEKYPKHDVSYPPPPPPSYSV